MITLTTDYGYKDPFAGMVRGAILSITPSAQIVDITHGITPHNIVEGAITINASYQYFPPNSIHLVVVDPGVGSSRRPLLVRCGKHFFIGPDNGVFTEVIRANREDFEVRHVMAGHYFLSGQGNTFHGRDVFAPIAAWLSKGILISNFGSIIEDFVTLSLPIPRMGADRLEGDVILVDGFGNAITNIRREHLERITPEITPSTLRVLYRGGEARLAAFYSEAGGAAPHALINGNGHLEIFVFQGSAAKATGLKVGDKVGVLAAPGQAPGPA